MTSASRPSHVPVHVRGRALRRRVAAPVAAAAVALAGCAFAPSASAAEAPRPSAASAPEAPDHFSEVHADPLDMTGGEDLLLDAGPTAGLEDLRRERGQLRGRLVGPGYVSPVWGGYPDAFHVDRDGGAARNTVDASRYDRVAFAAYVSKPVDAGLFWFGCEALDDRCMGGRPLRLEPGWHVYSVPARNAAYGLPAEWTGRLTGVRLALTPTAPDIDVRLDWFRVLGAGSTSVAWSSPASGEGARLFYDADGSDANNTGGAPGWGPLPCDGQAECRTSGSATTDVSFLPPGTYRFWAQADDGTRSPVSPALAVTARPRPVVVDPDAVGGPDWATEVLGDPWDMSSRADADEIGGTRDVAVGGGRLHGTNASNDPYVWLQTRGRSIDPARYHRFTITSGYDGPFGLDDAVDGGAHGRVVWRAADRAPVQQTREVLTYSGTRTTTLDLGLPASEVHETDVPGRDWRAAPVTGLRWDPNEDRGARRWWVDEVALRADDETGGDFRVRWRDDAHRPGSRVTVGAARDLAGREARTLANDLPGGAGTRSWTWDTRSVPEGTWYVFVDITSASGQTTRAWSGGPVRVDRRLAGQGASPVAVAVRDVQDACPDGTVPPSGLTDVPGGSVGEAVDCVAWYGITRGNGGGAYDAGRTVTREQMASFLARLLPRAGGSVPSGAPDAFSDDDGSIHEDAIDAMAAAGVVAGTGGGRFDPSAPVTRDQMATFLRRTWARSAGSPLPDGPTPFADVRGTAHEGSVGAVAALGVTGGRTSTSYDPRSGVTRGQMASFLARLLDASAQEGRTRLP